MSQSNSTRAEEGSHCIIVNSCLSQCLVMRGHKPVVISREDYHQAGHQQLSWNTYWYCQNHSKSTLKDTPALIDKILTEKLHNYVIFFENSTFYLIKVKQPEFWEVFYKICPYIIFRQHAASIYGFVHVFHLFCLFHLIVVCVSKKILGHL